MPPDNSSNEHIREIQRRLTLFTRVDGAAITEKQIKAIFGEAAKLGLTFDQGSKKASGFATSLKAIGTSAKDGRSEIASTVGVVGGLAVAMSRFGDSSHVLSKVLGGGFLAIGAKELDNYSKALLTTTAQFNKYGDGAYKVEQAAIRVGKEFGFTREEAMNLMKTIEQGFNYKPIGDMTNYMRLLENTVGANEQAMARYSDKIAALSQQIPGLQEITKIGIDKDGLISQQDIKNTREYAASLMAAGKMSMQDFKSALDFGADSQAARQGVADKNAGRANVDRDRQDEVNKSLKAMQELERTVNEIALSTGEKLRPTLITIADIVKSINPQFINIASSVGLVGAGLAAALGLMTGLARGGSMLFRLAKGVMNIGSLGRMGRQAAKGNVAGALSSMGASSGGGSGGAVPVFVVNMPGSGMTSGAGGLGGVAGGLGGGKLSAKQSIAKMGVANFGGALLGGAAIGALGGEITDFITDKLGLVKPEEGGYASGALRVGGRIAAGAATGGVVGAIGAGAGSIISDSYESIKVARDIYDINKGITKQAKDQSDLAKTKTDEMRKGGASGLDIAISEQAEKVRAADEQRASSQGLFSGWTGQKSRAEAKLKEEQNKLQRLVAQRGSRNKESVDLEKQAEAERKITEEQKNQDEKLMRLGQQQQNLNKFVEAQKDLVSSTNSLYESQLSVLTAAGGAIPGSVDKAFSSYNEFAKQIDQANNLIDTQLSLMNQVSKTFHEVPGSAEDVAKAMERVNAALRSGNLDEMEKTIAEVAKTAGGLTAVTARQKALETEQLQNGIRKRDAAKQLSTIYRDNQRMQEVEVSQIEANISLADNLAMGVAASAQQRMAAVREISDVINSKRAEQLILEKQIGDAQKRQESFAAAAATGDKKAIQELAQAKADEFQHVLRYKEINVENTRLIQKQAELTRVLRDGWVNAINSMNNGVGMFTKIKIDRETRLGTLMSRAPKPVVGLATGFAGPGRRESVGYSALAPGVLTNPDNAGRAFGAGSDAWANAIDKRTPLGMLGGNGGMIDPDQAASGVGLWQELIGKNLSTATAGAAAAPFGMGGLLGEIDKATDKITGSVQTIKAESALPVKLTGASIALPVEMQGAIARNRGGIVPGSGPNVDSVAMLATPGEGILSRDAMKAVGERRLNALNSGKFASVPARDVMDTPQVVQDWQRQERKSLYKVANDKFRTEVGPVYDNLTKGGPDRLAWSHKVDELEKIFEDRRKQIEASRTFDEFSAIASDIGAPAPNKPPEVAGASIRPTNPLTPGLEKTSISDIARMRPDLLTRAESEVIHRLNQDINRHNAKENELVTQLRKTSDQDQVKKIAAQRIANRDQLQASKSELYKISHNMMTPSVSNLLMKYKNQSDNDSAASMVQQSISKQMSNGPSVTAPLVSRIEDMPGYKEKAAQDQAYQQSNSGRLPGQFPADINNWLEGLQSWQRDVVTNLNKKDKSEEFVRDTLSGIFASSPLAAPYQAMLIRMLGDKATPGKNLQELSGQLNSQISTIQNFLPHDDEGLRGAFYAQQIEDIANEALPRNQTSPDRIAFYEAIKSKALSIKSLVRGGDYSKYQGQVRPVVDEINQISVKENVGLESINRKFDNLYKNLILSQEPDFGRYALPQLARGGLVPQSPGGQPVVVGEGRFPEIVSPIPMLQKVVQEALQQAMSEERKKAISQSQSTISPMMDTIDRSVSNTSIGGDYSSVSSDTSGSVQITLTDAQMSQLREGLVNEFSNSFRGVAEAAMSRVMDELNHGV